MSRTTYLARAAVALIAVGALAACDKDKLLINPPGPTGSLFSSYVAMGNSLTAGYQSGGINDSTQKQAYPYLLARKVGTRYAYASLAMPGCTAPIANFQTQALVGGAMAGTCAFRANAPFPAVLNNTGVPGARVVSPTSIDKDVAGNTLTTLILGGKSQVQKAREAQPTFVTAWFGNNDVLDATTNGVVVPTPALGVTRGLTSVADFQTNYKLLVDSLKTISTIKGGVLIGVVQVTNIPLLFPAAAFQSPTFKGGFDQFVGKPTTILSNCVGSSSLISFRIVGFLRSRPAAEPAVIGCEKQSIPGNDAVGDYFVLDAAEQATINTTVAAYNAYIQSQAGGIGLSGFGYYDPNPTLLAAKAQTGCVAPAPNLASALQPFGSCFSLDGVHPSATGQILITNALIGVINAKYGTTIGTVP